MFSPSLSGVYTPRPSTAALLAISAPARVHESSFTVQRPTPRISCLLKPWGESLTILDGKGSHLLLLLGPRGGLGARFGLAQQVPVSRRAEEARVAVFGHEHVDLVLGRVEAREWRLQHVGSGDVTGFVVNINLLKKKQEGQVSFPFFFRVCSND